MRTAIVGHRGVGKSSFLRRIRTYFQHEERSVLCLDLDQEIERRQGRSVSSIFAEDGEAAFRWIEIEVFRAIDQETQKSEHDVYLVLGGGFDPSALPDSWRCLWVRRTTDAQGRIFIDRPRLEADLTPLEEYRRRYVAREPRFAARADEVLWIDEGLDSPDEAECGFVVGDLQSIGGAVTIRPAQFFRPQHFETWARSRVNFGLRWFEFRDDLLSIEQMEQAIRLFPDDRVIVAFRDIEKAEETAKFVERHALAFDWPLEYGPSIFGDPRFISLHERKEGESVKEALARFPKEIPYGTQLKAALPTADFEELRQGDEWQRAFPEARIFLPMSGDGRWAWYRLLKGNSYDLNFIRDFEGSAPDQPSLLQWARRARLAAKVNSFAAILGDPVSHSRTPMEHASFFALREAPVLAVRISEDEWRAGGFSILASLGLTWAAVTSPLKRVAYEACSGYDETAEALLVVNTLERERTTWFGANTDREGFEALVARARETGSVEKVAAWGGGGTLDVILSVLPDTEAFSASSGENRDSSRIAASSYSPDVIVWAVGRSHPGLRYPPESWRPRVVLDLNYSEDSPGREYAMKVGCGYISGLEMFRAQAEGQRRIWEKS